MENKKIIRLSDDQKHRAERVLAQADRNRDEIRFRLKVIEQQKPLERTNTLRLLKILPMIVLFVLLASGLKQCQQNACDSNPMMCD